MAQDQITDRWREIRGIHREFSDFYDLLGTVVIAAFVILFIRIIFPPDASDFDMNLTTEIVGIVVTIVVIDRRNARREMRRYQQQLIDDAASISNDIAKNAVYQIERKGWLSGSNGILRSANLSSSKLQEACFDFANLQEVNLLNSNLQSASFFTADLQEANLSFANLTNARLFNANLQRAYFYRTTLHGANLQLADMCRAQWSMVSAQSAVLLDASLQEVELMGVSMHGTDLRRADFENARFSGTVFHGADLTGANLKGVTFDLQITGFNRNTFLPDGNNWDTTTDIEKFTNPNHPDFWRSSDPASPAFHG